MSSAPTSWDDPDQTLAAARRGDRQACDVLLRQHQPMIWAVCRRIVGDDHSAADAAQEALIAVVRGLGRFDGRSNVRTWIYRVATNAALDELRRRRRRPETAPDEVLTTIADTASAGLGLVDDRLLVDAALADLPPEFRAAVVLRDLVDLDYAEISDILGVPPGTVRSRIARGRRALARRLAGHDGNRTPDDERPNDRPEDGPTPDTTLP